MLDSFILKWWEPQQKTSICSTHQTIRLFLLCHDFSLLLGNNSGITSGTLVWVPWCFKVYLMKNTWTKHDEKYVRTARDQFSLRYEIYWETAHPGISITQSCKQILPNTWAQHHGDRRWLQSYYRSRVYTTVSFMRLYIQYYNLMLHLTFDSLDCECRVQSCANVHKF